MTTPAQRRFPAAQERAETSPGHRNVLELLDREQDEKPHQRAQMGGMVLFDLVMNIIADERGVHIQNLIAILASCGGASCLKAAFAELREAGRTPQEAGMMVIEGADGRTYYYGDLPNRYLWESETSLLSLTLGAAQGLGAQVSVQMVEETMGHVAKTVGSPEFGIPRLGEGDRASDLPIEWVKVFQSKLAEALDTYEVPPQQRPAAFGFAIQRAMEAGRQAAPVDALARLALECSVPMAKLDV